MKKCQNILDCLIYEMQLKRTKRTKHYFICLQAIILVLMVLIIEHKSYLDNSHKQR